MTNAPNKRVSDWDRRKITKAAIETQAQDKRSCVHSVLTSSYSFNHKQPGVIHLSGIHHCSHSNGESHGGHFGKVIPKETGIGYYGVLGQGLHSGPGDETGARLIKGDVPIWTNA